MKTKKHNALRSGCPVNVVLETLGDAWSFLIVRDLLFRERKTFNEFLHAEEKIATNILSNRLQRLEAAGIVSKQRDSDDTRRYIYRLTEKGIDLAPLLVEMVVWATKHEKTAMPPALVQQITGNREAYIADIRRRRQCELPASCCPDSR
ncbi:helix-turn-helix transcriptional regulator [Candidatus Methylospira mobilis]|uniref:Helix-turn-helix transcriptional regulator n=1 Tax=Candidatus Methylospira mobilis TaxID=1808979 RepID=A0A5Q0BEF4_9GAMM|nr:helix-turn-helix domain-containing protein [Candidatus Methylospira mobilis]QFY42200.1 helix-turn-helix transcriptional regulator [Candidatus Methylospira mobilis]WNV03215.1 helix-turn-helix domain-containing protein [Candidatus Methylospira mobilis]